MTSSPSMSTTTVNWYSPWKSAGCVMKRAPHVASVGSRTIVTKDGRVFRVFYPAEQAPESAKPTSWFRVSLGSVVDGYLHAYGGLLGSGLRKGGMFFEIVSLIARAICGCLPLRNATIPECFDDLTPKSEARIPLLLWSHGLTGTADENALLAAALAADSNVVAIVTHCDGSSSKVDFGQSSLQPLYYQHPDLKDYDRTMRQRQIEHRATEIEAVRTLLLNGGAGADLQDLIDPKRVAVGGFSFGAATAAFIAATNPSAYRCALLVDGWFHIELKKLGVSMDQPAAAHQGGIAIPSLFVGSAEFQGYAALADATARLRAKCAAGSDLRAVPGTGHHNFAEIVWWVSAPLLRSSGLAGKADPFSVYRGFVDDLRAFLRAHCA